MIISLRIKDAEAELIRQYAELHGKSVSETVREAILEKIEDELDADTYEKAMKFFASNPKTVSFSEMEKALDLQ